jgi:tetratricopeptide (TPR) repeat protein
MERERRSGLPIITLAGLLVVFVFLTWTAGRAGFSSFLTAKAVKSNLFSAANTAVSLNPADPDAHLVRGAFLEIDNDLPGAIAEYNLASKLRPDDYVVWLDLARASELNGDRAVAIKAAREAVRLAPYYAQPHWQLGNILVRAGARDEGFMELGLAGQSNPTFMPSVIDLAWQSSNGNVEFVVHALKPQRPESYHALASYFRKQGQIDAAISMYEAGGDAAQTDRKAYVGELISTKHFKEAYALWSYGQPANSKDPVALIIDSGFEQEAQLDEPGFGWRGTQKPPSLTMGLDSVDPKEGRSSLRVDFNGDSATGVPIISQLVLIQPKTDYQLRFYFRTEGVVSGGVPRISILDAGDNHLLGQSGGLTQTTAGWLDATIDFVSGTSSEAMRLSLQREGCPQGPCPIYGRLWLDGFSLEKR